MRKREAEQLLLALDPPPGVDALGSALAAVRVAADRIEGGLPWSAIAARGAESAAQRDDLVRAVELHDGGVTAGASYDRALHAVWQLIRRLNEERTL